MDQISSKRNPVRKTSELRRAHASSAGRQYRVYMYLKKQNIWHKRRLKIELTYRFLQQLPPRNLQWASSPVMPSVLRRTISLYYRSRFADICSNVSLRPTVGWQSPSMGNSHQCELLSSSSSSRLCGAQSLPTGSEGLQFLVPVSATLKLETEKDVIKKGAKRNSIYTIFKAEGCSRYHNKRLPVHDCISTWIILTTE